MYKQTKVTVNVKKCVKFYCEDLKTYILTFDKFEMDPSVNSILWDVWFGSEQNKECDWYSYDNFNIEDNPYKKLFIEIDGKISEEISDIANHIIINDVDDVMIDNKRIFFNVKEESIPEDNGWVFETCYRDSSNYSGSDTLIYKTYYEALKKFYDSIKYHRKNIYPNNETKSYFDGIFKENGCNISFYSGTSESSSSYSYKVSPLKFNKEKNVQNQNMIFKQIESDEFYK